MNEVLEAWKRVRESAENADGDAAVYEIGDCDIIEKELKEKEEIANALNRMSYQCGNLLRYKAALKIIKEKRVDADYFIYTCVVDDWSYEDYLEEYNSNSSWFICGQRSFGYQDKKQPLLTREEYYLLKEVLL